MEKKELRKALSTLNIGDKLNVTFRQGSDNSNGEYSLVSKKTGRGKGGSLIVVLADALGNSIESGTADSDNILNVTAHGEFYGFTSESEVPPVFTPDPEKSAVLKNAIEKMVVGETVTIDSSYAPLAGTFKLLEIKKLRGRGAQVAAVLEASDGSTVELWSHRHSGVATVVCPETVVSPVAATDVVVEEDPFLSHHTDTHCTLETEAQI